MFSQYFRLPSAGAGAGAGPDAGPDAGAELARSAFLERLLARADGFSPVVDWRADAFRVIAPGAAKVPAVASVALFADLGATQGAWVCLASPVHYVAEISNVRLAANGVLLLSPADAGALAADFNRVWADSGIRLTAGRCGTLYGIFDQALEAITRDPADVAGRHIEAYLPLGTDAPRLRKLMSEAEMWLFEHAANHSRIAQGLSPVSGLWLWGGGPLLAALPPVQGWCAGEDVFFNAFRGGAHGAAAGTGTAAEPGAAAGSGTAAEPGTSAGSGTAVGRGGHSIPGDDATFNSFEDQSGPGVIVLPDSPGTPAWAHAESRWLKPALEALRSGNIARLYVSAGDRCFKVGAFGSRRFWRRPKPWWEYFQVSAA